MLFDLKGKRKRLVQVVYVGLAILFAGGLVLFGVGGNVSGGLIDAFRGNNGGGASTSAFDDVVKRANARALRTPDDPAAWAAVVRAQFNLASSPAGSDASTGALTDRGQQAVVEVSQAWRRYERLKPKTVDPSAAAFAALAYGALQDYNKAVKIQEAALKSRPSPNGYFQLADFAYRADDVARGDAAAKEAVRRTPSDQRNTVRSLIKDLKKQGAQVAKAVAQAKKAQKQAAKQGKGQPAGQSFGPLPGQGAAGGTAPTPTP
jgi:tetratricopeptide (TPR) repeat protein